VLNGIVAGPDLVVAVGEVLGADRSTAAIWTSPDGMTWSRVADTKGFEDHGLLSIAYGRGRFVASGATCGSECEGQAYWASTDGTSWSFSGDVGNFCCLISDIAAGGPGFVAVGADESTGFPLTPADGEVSVSSDGLSWDLIRGSDEFKAVTFGSVVAAGPGLVALGFAGRPEAWTSTDGRNWTVSGGDVGTGEMQALTLGGPGLVAVGRDGSSAVSWTSPDGRSWSRAPAPAGPGVMHSVANLGGTLIAAGSRPDGAAVWYSRDGTEWTPGTLPQGAAQQITRVIAFGGGAIAIGSGPSGEPVVLVGR
jgi:hypothetical protein